MTFDMNNFEEMVQELIEDGNLDVLEKMGKTISKSKKTVKANNRRKDREEKTDARIQERIRKMSEGYAVSSSKKVDSEITVLFKNEELIGRFISTTQNGATVSIDGERKVIPFYQVVA